MEAKVKIILNTAKTRAEAQRLLQKEKFRDEDIVRIMQKYYRRSSRENLSYLSPSSDRLASSVSSSSVSSPSKKGLSTKDQHLELMGFAQNLHVLNQEMHKNLRTNKQGVPITNIDKLPIDYKRPPGFSLVPNLLGNIPNSDHHILNLIKANGKNNQQFDGSDEKSR